MEAGDLDLRGMEIIHGFTTVGVRRIEARAPVPPRSVGTIFFKDWPASWRKKQGYFAPFGVPPAGIWGPEGLTSKGEPMSKRRQAVIAGVVMVVLAACGTADDLADDDGTVADVTSTETTAGGETIEVTADDYVFNGIPETVSPGTSFTLANRSEAEVHEMVVVRIADEETRSLEELLELSEEESEDLTEFQGVLVALPGEQGIDPTAQGDSITVADPGRYAVVCFIPEGADPAEVEEAMASADESEEPPSLGGGPPHAFLGMLAEFQVEG